MNKEIGGDRKRHPEEVVFGWRTTRQKDKKG